MTQYNLFYSNYSDLNFKDSCVNQLISIAHSVFDANPSLGLWGILLDLSKELDKFWYKDLL